MLQRKPKLSKRTREKLIEHFIAGTTARSAAELVGINRNTAAKWFKWFREIIVSRLENNPLFEGEIEVDESYFGGKRKGQRGRGATGKIPVFGILKRGGSVHTQVLPNVSSKTLIPIINQKVLPDSVVYTDTFTSYNKLDVTRFKHQRINHSKQFADKRNHINGIENFWNQAKRHLTKFNGIPKEHFHMYIKECEWRFNFGSVSNLLKTLKKWVQLERKKKK